MATSPPASRTAGSLWLGTPSEPRFQPLRGDVIVDVAILGGGITGLTLALLLKRAGKRVAVLESRHIGAGVTGHTTAHLTQAVDERYTTLSKRFGESGARIVAESSRAAIDRIEAFVRELSLDCEFERVPGFLYAEREDDLRMLHEEFEAAREAGLSVTMTREVPLPFTTAAAVRFDQQAQIHAMRYLSGLAAAVDGGGAHIFEGTHVTDVIDGTPCVLTTAQGIVRAENVVSATNAPLTRFFAQTKVAAYRSYVIAFKPRAPLTKALYWDTDDPYHYTRTAEIDGATYVIVGGEDHKTGQEENTEGCYTRLVAYARSRFAFDEVEYRWSAQVEEPVDGLPYVGRSSKGSHVWIATGYSGTGMTFGTMAAGLLTDLLLDRHNAWTELYDANRVSPSSAKEYVAENVDFPSYMVGDRLRSADATSLDQVAPGEGKIVRLDGKKLAVFRDENGVATALSPVCPHLGCHVHFNNAEKTWDCPCHGSRFDTRGDVLHGPALTGLSPARGPSLPAPASNAPVPTDSKERIPE